MFCSNSGGKLQEGAAFCAGCGAKVGGGVSEQGPPMPVAPQVQTVMVRDFRCNNCGAPLKIPANSNAPVRCPSCKTECLIERAIRNSEIAAKENIESGIPLSASPAKLHNIILSVLSKSPNMPLDVFEKAEVIREEHYCIPAYAFHCDGTQYYSYDVCNIREHKTTADLGDRVRTEWEKYEEWTNGEQGTAAVRQIVVASGNRQMVKQLQNLYSNFNPKKLVDIETLSFPFDVETSKPDIPQTTAFNEFAAPIIEKELKETVKENLAKRKTRNLQMAGSNIRKEVTRMFLGMYRIVFKYANKEHSIWVNGDGSKWWWNEGLPEDMNLKKTLEQRQKAVDEKEREMEESIASIPEPKTGVITALMWVCIILALPTAGITIIGAIIFGIIRSNMRKPYNTQCAEMRADMQREIDTFNSETDDIKGKAENVAKQFRSKKKALRGIYEGVTGDPSAF